jgi:hypothetical protein
MLKTCVLAIMFAFVIVAGDAKPLDMALVAATLGSRPPALLR